MKLLHTFSIASFVFFYKKTLPRQVIEILQEMEIDVVPP